MNLEKEEEVNWKLIELGVDQLREINAYRFVELTIFISITIGLLGNLVASSFYEILKQIYPNPFLYFLFFDSVLVIVSYHIWKRFKVIRDKSNRDYFEICNRIKKMKNG